MKTHAIRVQICHNNVIAHTAQRGPTYAQRMSEIGFSNVLRTSVGCPNRVSDIRWTEK